MAAPSGRRSRRFSVAAGMLGLVSLAAVATITPASRGTALGPVVAITPFEVISDSTIGEVFGPSLSGRGEVAGVSDREVIEVGFVHLDVAGPEPTVEAYGITVSGDGCAALSARPVSESDVNVEMVLTDRCRGLERVVHEITGSYEDDSALALSHDARFAAFQVESDSEFGPRSWIARVDTETLDVRLMPTVAGTDRVVAEYGLDISDDGTVVVVTVEGEVLTEVAAWDVGSDTVSLVSAAGDPAEVRWSTHPSISGDGRWVSFSSSRPRGTGETGIGPWVYVVDRASGGVRRVSGAGDASYSTSLSRDGSQAAFSVSGEPGCDYFQEFVDDLEFDCPPARIDVAYGPSPGLVGPFAVETVSVGAGGEIVGNHWEPALSGNGRWVAWTSDVGDVLLGVDADLDERRHAFMRRREPGLSIDAIAFGSIPVSTTADATTTVRNTGRTSVWLDSITVAPATFGIVPGGTCPSGGSLPPGATCTVAVRYTPGAAATTSDGSLVVAETGHDPVSAAASVTGSAVAPTTTAGPTTTSTTSTTTTPTTTVAPPTTTTPTTVPATTSPTAPALTATPGPVDFGSILVGTSSDARTVTVTNVGTGAGSVSIAMSGTHADDFDVATNRCATVLLAPASSCTIDISFSPRGGAARSATLTLTSGGSTVDVALTGVGRFEPRLAASPQAVTRRAITLVVGQSFPPGETFEVEVVDQPVTVTATSDDDGVFRAPLSPLGWASLGPYTLRVAGQPDVFDDVEAPLVVVLSTFEPRGASGPAFGTNPIVARGQ